MSFIISSKIMLGVGEFTEPYGKEIPSRSIYEIMH
jgi:hypothetical protein